MYLKKNFSGIFVLLDIFQKFPKSVFFPQNSPSPCSNTQVGAPEDKYTFVNWSRPAWDGNLIQGVGMKLGFEILEGKGGGERFFKWLVKMWPARFTTVPLTLFFFTKILFKLKNVSLFMKKNDDIFYTDTLIECTVVNRSWISLIGGSKMTMPDSQRYL